MKILLYNARETKSQFFEKRGQILHSSLVYTKDIINNKLNIQVFDHQNDDTDQDAWFTVSSLHVIFENLDPKLKQIIIISDNGLHYHYTKLMLIIGHQKDWYNITSRKQIFLEADKAKTLIDSYHVQVYYLLSFIIYSAIIYPFLIYSYQISQAIKHYVKLDGTIESDNDIEIAIHEIAGIRVANLLPNCNQGISVFEKNYQVIFFD